MRRRVLGLLSGGLALGLLGGCTTSVVQRGVERRLEKRLAGLLGPARRYRVRVLHTRSSDLVRGRAGRVEVEGDQVLAMRQFRLERLRLALEDLHYEGVEPYFISVRRSDLEVEFTDTALNDYLRARHARYEPEVRFEQDVVHVRMRYQFLGTPTVLRASGTFAIREGRQLLFRAESAEVPFTMGLEFSRRFVEDRINPLLDIARLDFPARLESVQLLPGRLRAVGSAALPSEVRD